ncbi:hypothetical protein BFJ70_g8522 [Fusarium oxysporum]|nr:hypothetical protein BFJ70_g8522 [Fusarium oxysporum]
MRSKNNKTQLLLMALILLLYMDTSLQISIGQRRIMNQNKALMSHAFGGAMGRWLAWVYGVSGLDHGNTVEQRYLGGASG